jgi:hypothetical protein
MVKRMVAVVFGTSHRNKVTPAAKRMPCQILERRELAASCDRFSIDSIAVGTMALELSCAIVRRAGNGFFETAELFGGHFIVSQEREQKPLAGVAEESLHGVSDFKLAGLVLGDAGAVEIGPALLTVADIAFLFQDSNRGQHGVVGESSVRRHGCDQVSDQGFSTLPENLHES